jgi:NAD(P)-dependent dehydrogenase (short-subunit alcohol dehydrogenase family)
VGWLDGKAALVVGGGSGIGRAVVDAFVAEGASVGVLELDPERCQRLSSMGKSVRAIQGDATSRADNERAVRETLDAFGALDTLATFVGVFDYYTHLDAIADEQLDAAFDELFAANVKSCLLSAKAALEPLSAARGSVVLTVSTSGFYPGRGGVLYVASKFAVRGIVVQLAHELAPRVRVNGVAPGGTLDTELRGAHALGLAERRLGDDPGREEALRARTPLEIALRPDDHAGAYVFLASDRARGITGIVVNSDGGIGVRG